MSRLFLPPQGRCCTFEVTRHTIFLFSYSFLSFLAPCPSLQVFIGIKPSLHHLAWNWKCFEILDTDDPSSFSLQITNFCSCLQRPREAEFSNLSIIGFSFCICFISFLELTWIWEGGWLLPVIIQSSDARWRSRGEFQWHPWGQWHPWSRQWGGVQRGWLRPDDWDHGPSPGEAAAPASCPASYAGCESRWW